MQKVEEFSRQNVLVASVGGSMLYPRRDVWRRLHENQKNLWTAEVMAIDFHEPSIHGIIGWCEELVSRKYDTFIVTGGGILARLTMADAQRYARNGYEVSRKQLDEIGKDASALNASRIKGVLEGAGLPVYWNSRVSWGKPREGQKGRVFVRGGTEPGHTTDMVAVQVAIAEKIPFVVNIGNTSGLHPSSSENALGYDPSRVVETVSITDYLAMFPGVRSPGDNFIFEREAAIKARENGVGVLLIGPDFANSLEMLSGREFVGTYLRPE